MSEKDMLARDRRAEALRGRMEAAALGARLAAIDAAYERQFPGVQRGAVRGRVTGGGGGGWRFRPVDVATFKPTYLAAASAAWTGGRRRQGRDD